MSHVGVIECHVLKSKTTSGFTFICFDLLHLVTLCYDVPNNIAYIIMTKSLKKHCFKVILVSYDIHALV